MKALSLYLCFSKLCFSLALLAIPSPSTITHRLDLAQQLRISARQVPSRKRIGTWTNLFDPLQTTTTTALKASLSTTVASAAATRGINNHYLVRILFLRGLSFVFIFAFLGALRQNKGLIGDNGITPASEVLDCVEDRAREKRKRREEWWEEQKKQGKTRIPLPASIYSENDVMALLRNTKFGRTVGDILNGSKWCQDMREVFWDRSDRMGRLYPTLLWLVPKEDRRTDMNTYLDMIALVGIALSATMFLLGAANVPLLLALWICQRSIMSVGGCWYGFGWEPQLAELTFHAMFMAPTLSLAAIPYDTPVPKVTIWAMRWFLFRIMIGAGLIKMRSSDPKWKFRGPKRLSTMDYFYETQPVPNPITRYFHRMPKAWHRFEVLTNHFVELVAPWLLILPGINRNWRIFGGFIQLAFQCTLITSGNLSFLNWLTMLPALYCFDDAFVSNLFSPGYTTYASLAAYTDLSVSATSICRQIVNLSFIILIAKLSVPVVKNLLSKKQIMNGSFDPLRLVNTYGAFGTVEEVREELIIEAADDYKGPWREYEFKVKPGNVNRTPRFISPYHYRLDWGMWIASVGGDINNNPWIYSLLKKLLEQDQEVTKLLANDPFKDEGKPKYIRVTKYKYRFGERNEEGKSTYWVREKLGRYFPKQGLCSIDMLEDILDIL